MWSQYDENLYLNPFFKFIQRNHNDILERASMENWVICIPRHGTLESYDFTTDIILDHILIPGNEEEENIHYTLSKKQVNVQNGHITTNNSSEDYPNGIEICFEETFYIEKTAKYKVLCIENPLFLYHDFCNSHPNKVLINLQDCIDFLWCECSGHRVLDSIKHLVAEFIQEHKEIEVEDLQTQKELIGKLFSQCLQIGLKNEALKKKCMSNNKFFDNFKLAMETYMQFCLGQKLLFCINTLQHQSNSYLNKLLRNSSSLQYQDLGIPQQLSDNLTSAKCEMNKINNYCTVLDKLNCFKRIFSIIHVKNNELQRSFVTSDDILQVIVFLIVKVNVNNWMTNLIFLKEFQLSSSNIPDQASFIITSFEAAIEFIKSNQFLDMQKKVDLLNASQSDSKCLNNNIASSPNLIPKNFLLEKKLCHPLCTCSKCKNISDQNCNWISMDSQNCNEIGQNLLLLATISGNSEVVEYLLNQNFYVDVTDYFGKTSLHYAANRGYLNIVLLLMNRHANVNIKDNEKNTPLHLACTNGQENCVKALIYSSREVELNIGNYSGETPLHLATIWGYYEIIKILLENGATPGIKNGRNQTVSDLAPNYYIVKLVETFEMKQNNTVKENTNEPVTLQVVDNQQKYCNDLGECPNHITQSRKIAHLLKAIEYNDFPLARFYLGFCSDSKTSEIGNCHPLCICEKCQKSEDEINDFQKHEAININMCDITGHTPLHVAAKFGRPEILRLILDSGASVNVQTYNDLYTPLHLACIFQHTQIVQELVKCGNSKIDKQDFKGNTALHHACAANDLKIVRILLNNGANCRKKNFLGKSPLQESEENMQYRVSKLMRTNLDNIRYKLK